MDKNNMLNDDHWELQKKIAKITTIELVLKYRFPDLRLGFLYSLSYEELDEIIDNISTITLEELQGYTHE